MQGKFSQESLVYFKKKALRGKEDGKMSLRSDCNYIVSQAIRQVQPHSAVKRALEGRTFSQGRLLVVSVGKAAWSMAQAAYQQLGRRIDGGIVITKHGHAQGEIGPLLICEAGHPVPDQDTFSATQKALELTSNLTEDDTVVFLLSGGGSALFEAPLIPEEELLQLTKDLLACGADIIEMNTIRKRLSAVKGGRFAEHCQPAKMLSIVLSDIIGDPLDMIASGPAYPDSSTCEGAKRVVEKYQLPLSEQAAACLDRDTPKQLHHVETVITGSVRQLCLAGAEACRTLGYEPVILTDCLTCQAKEAGAFLAAIARSHQQTEKPLAFLAGGETVVVLTGKGLGGRNQEIALGAVEGIAGLTDTAVFSVGSDGTDGPTDAAGGFVSGETLQQLQAEGVDVFEALKDNDSYHALSACGGLILTGATGTNVNDLSCLLIQREHDTK